MSWLGRLITIIVVILVIAWIIGQPATAGNAVHGWITAVITFFKHIE